MRVCVVHNVVWYVSMLRVIACVRACMVHLRVPACARARLTLTCPPHGVLCAAGRPRPAGRGPGVQRRRRQPAVGALGAHQQTQQELIGLCGMHIRSSRLLVIR